MGVWTKGACIGCLAAAAFSAAASIRTDGVTVNGSAVTDVERRSFVDGTAVRYRLPDGVRRISGEDTVWTMPTDATAWYQVEHDEGVGLSYESLYVGKKVSDIPVGTKILLPIVFKLEDGTYRLITEANVVDYTDSCVVYRGEGRFAIDYYCDPKGFVQEGSGTTPWRVEIVAKDLQTLMTSDMVRRLCPDPTPEVAAKCATFVKPGRAVWQWVADGAPIYGEQKKWYDQTKALGYEYYLVDDGWRNWCDGNKDQWACLKKWIDYGKSIGVESFMWVDSKEMLEPSKRRAYLAKVKASGAVGIKIDFVPPPSYRQMKWYEETLVDTLEFGLMTDFHGCVKPSGRERTWPHEVAREAIRGHEYHITRYRRILPPEHDTIVPFSRLVQGHADYTPTVLGTRELVRFTWPREVAQGIAYAAPFLCTADYPENYLKSPMVQIIKALPAVYDETRVLSGAEIGRLYAAARRKGDTWFVAVMNANKKREWTLDCSFLGDGEWRVLGFKDNPKPRLDDTIRMDLDVTKDSKLDILLRPCGGFVAMILPKAEAIRRTPWQDDIQDGVHGFTNRGYEKPTDPLVLEELEKFKDRKLGLMMHFGLYTQLGIPESWPLVDSEARWSRRLVDWKKGDDFKREYIDMYKSFNPVRFQPDVWARIAKRDGFKYLVFTTKHHDGFCLFDSKYSDYKVTSPECPFSKNPKADIVKNVFDAFRKEGLSISCYFSKPDWHHPDFWDNCGIGYKNDRIPSYDVTKEPARWKNYATFVRNQLLELTRDYGPIDQLWLDGGQVRRGTVYDIGIEDIVREARKIRPGLIAVDRGGRGFAENIVTPEQTVPAAPLGVPWESCITMGTGFSYRYDDTYKSERELIHLLIDVVAKGGNLALNVAPGPDGRIPQPAIDRMDALGRWLAKNGEAIYGTREVAPYRNAYCAFTQSKDGKNVYVIRTWAEGQRRLHRVFLSGLTTKARRIVHLASGRNVGIERLSGGVMVELPPDVESGPYADAFRVEE